MQQRAFVVLSRLHNKCTDVQSEYRLCALAPGRRPRRGTYADLGLEQSTNCAGRSQVPFPYPTAVNVFSLYAVNVRIEIVSVRVCAHAFHHREILICPLVYEQPWQRRVAASVTRVGRYAPPLIHTIIHMYNRTVHNGGYAHSENRAVD